ncbi:unnamed protein product [Allacma fusca]|uniref:Uncharacterized protein n=1 Tax=Allacma fusca TaxID=39272 RepID=A0A8J2KFC7_9HEXA|nr:unnamed protein product [Allacma fusca]
MASPRICMSILAKNELIDKLETLGMKPVIDNLMMLKSNTCNLQDLATRFLEAELLSYEEKSQAVQDHTPQPEQVEQLFKAVLKRPNWRKVIDAMEKTGNRHIVEELRTYVNTNPEPYCQNPRTGTSKQFFQNQPNLNEITHPFPQMQQPIYDPYYETNDDYDHALMTHPESTNNWIYENLEPHYRVNTIAENCYVWNLARNGKLHFAAAAIGMLTVIWVIGTLFFAPTSHSANMPLMSETGTRPSLDTARSDVDPNVLSTKTSQGSFTYTNVLQFNTSGKNNVVSHKHLEFVPITVMNPNQLFGLPQDGSDLHIIVSPSKAYNWENLEIPEPISIRVLEVNGHLDPRSVKSILEKLQNSLVKIIFSVEIVICQEFFSHNVRPNSPTVNLKLLHEIHFRGDDCSDIYEFVENEISLENIRRFHDTIVSLDFE